MLDPPENGDALSVERLLRLPSGFVCFAPPAQAPSPRRSNRGGQLAFGDVIETAKLNGQMARLWARIVDNLPGSRLAVQTGEFKDAGVRLHVANMLREAGVPDHRYELLDDPPDYPAYLESFAAIDVLLDPAPYSGVTTTCEALWQGVPVVTLAGDRRRTRQAESARPCRAR